MKREEKNGKEVSCHHLRYQYKSRLLRSYTKAHFEKVVILWILHIRCDIARAVGMEGLFGGGGR